jgi:hypothetical protein
MGSGSIVTRDKRARTIHQMLEVSPDLVGGFMDVQHMPPKGLSLKFQNLVCLHAEQINAFQDVCLEIDSWCVRARLLIKNSFDMTMIAANVNAKGGL